jgi:AcrR family transcriptional regulator
MLIFIVQNIMLLHTLQGFLQQIEPGRRINEIAQRCKTSRRMIYYHFDSREGLYRQVLEAAYQPIRGEERDLELDYLDPVTALSTLVEFTFKHHNRHPDFIRMIMIENIYHGKFLMNSEVIKELNAPAINRIKEIYNRGIAEGLFRTGISASKLHWYISALSFFNVSNRTSFSIAFGNAFESTANQNMLSQHTKDMILRFVLSPEHICNYIRDGLGLAE